MTVVAIDGPAGAGKSTVARAVADALDYRYLDTGAMYRAIALASLERGVALGDEGSISAIARSVEVDVVGDRILLDERDVTERIRDSDVTSAVSMVSAYKDVRTAMVERQRAIAGEADVVVEGRDIGTTVFPHADVKVFLTASLDVRARRRSEQMGDHRDEEAFERFKSSIAERDEADSRRESSPLRRAEGAIEVDTTDRSIAEVVAEIVGLVENSHG